MTKIQPNKHTVSFGRIGAMSDYIDATGYYRAPSNTNGDTYEKLESTPATGATGWLNSFSGDSANVTLAGTLSNEYANCYGVLAIDGVKQPGLYSLSYDSSRSSQGGNYSLTFLTHTIWDERGSKQVDSPYGDIEGANEPNRYNYAFTYQGGPGTIGEYDITNMFYLYGYSSNDPNGVSSENKHWEVALGQYTGPLGDNEIDEIIEKATSACYTIYNKIPLITAEGTFGSNIAIQGIYVVPKVDEIIDNLNGSLVYKEFKERQKGDRVPANDDFSIQYNNGDIDTISGQDYAGKHDFAGLQTEFYSAYATKSNTITGNNLMLGSKVIRTFKPYTISFSAPSGLISFAQTMAGVTEVVSSGCIPDDFKIPSEALDYADVQEMMAISQATNYGKFYHEAVKVLNEDDHLVKGVGLIAKIFSFITWVLDEWQNSSIMEMLRVYKTIDATAQNTASKITDVSDTLMAPLIAQMKESFMTQRSNKLSSDLTVTDIPEWGVGSIGSGSAGYLDFSSVPQWFTVRETYGRSLNNKYGVSETKKQDATSFLVNDNAPIVSGTTIHVLPGHAYNITGKGREIVETIKVY